MCGGDYTRGRNLFIRPQHLVRGYFSDFMPFLQMFSSEDRRGADWVYPDLFLGWYPRMLMSAYEARTDRQNLGPSTIGLHKSKDVNMVILAQSSASCMSYFYSIYDDSSIFKSSFVETVCCSTTDNQAPVKFYCEIFYKRNPHFYEKKIYV